MFTDYQKTILKNLANCNKRYTTGDLVDLLKMVYSDLRGIENSILEEQITLVIYGMA